MYQPRVCRDVVQIAVKKERTRGKPTQKYDAETSILLSPPSFDLEAGLIENKRKRFKRDPAAMQRLGMVVEHFMKKYPELDEKTARTKIIDRLYNRRATTMMLAGQTLENFQRDDLAACRKFNARARVSKRPHLVIPLTPAEELSAQSAQPAEVAADPSHVGGGQTGGAPDPDGEDEICWSAAADGCDGVAASTEPVRSSPGLSRAPRPSTAADTAPAGTAHTAAVPCPEVFTPRTRARRNRTTQRKAARARGATVSEEHAGGELLASAGAQDAPAPAADTIELPITGGQHESSAPVNVDDGEEEELPSDGVNPAVPTPAEPVRKSPRLKENEYEVQRENNINCEYFLPTPHGKKPEYHFPKHGSKLVADGLCFHPADRKRKLSELFYRGQPCALENMRRMVQDLLPQVQEMNVTALVAHVGSLHARTGKAVHMTAKAVFLDGNQPAGFNLLPVKENNQFEITAQEDLEKRWNADLKKHIKASDALDAAFKATRQRAAPTAQRQGAPRTTRTARSMAESNTIPETITAYHMSVLCPAGRKAHVLRSGLTTAAQRKLRMGVHTREGAAMLEEWSHATYGELYECENMKDSTGTERDLDIYIGKEVFEHKTPPEWRALGHPPMMRCHCIGVDEGDEDSEPWGAFDYSLFHDDFTVETFEFEKLVGLELVRVPQMYITHDYSVWWKNPSGNDRALTIAEYRTGFSNARPKHLQISQFWEPM